MSAKIPVPELIERVSQGMTFVGVAGEKSIQGTFLHNLLINYDYNHQNGTHRELFGIKANRIPVFEQEGYWAKVVQELERNDPTFQDICRNPVILSARYSNHERLQTCCTLPRHLPQPGDPLSTQDLHQYAGICVSSADYL